MLRKKTNSSCKQPSTPYEESIYWRATQPSEWRRSRAVENTKAEVIYRRKRKGTEANRRWNVTASHPWCSTEVRLKDNEFTRRRINTTSTKTSCLNGCVHVKKHSVGQLKIKGWREGRLQEDLTNTNNNGNNCKASITILFRWEFKTIGKGKSSIHIKDSTSSVDAKHHSTKCIKDGD